MVANVIKYGGLYGKVCALYGNRLTYDDYERLLECQNVKTVAMYLKAHPAWFAALGDVNEDSLQSRGNIESVLRLGELRQIEKVMRFLSDKDKAILKNVVAAEDTYIVNSFLRYLHSGMSFKYVPNVPKSYYSISKIDFNLLLSAVNYDMLLDAAIKTPYYKALVRLKPLAGSEPNYNAVEIAIRTGCYRSFFEMAEKDMSGHELKVLTEAVGTEIDLYNLITIIRLKRYYPNNMGDAFQYMLPFECKLKKDKLREIYESDTLEETMKQISKTYYAKDFENDKIAYIEEVQYRFMYRIARKIMALPMPSLYTALAYVITKDVEKFNLIHIIECVRYHVDTKKAMSFLVGI